MTTPNTSPPVQGRCPACRNHTLTLTPDGHLTCGHLRCLAPEAADALLADPPPAPCSADIGFCPVHGYHRHPEPKEPTMTTDQDRDRIADLLARHYDGQPLADLRDEHATHHREAADALLADTALTYLIRDGQQMGSCLDTAPPPGAGRA